MLSVRIPVSIIDDGDLLYMFNMCSSSKYVQNNDLYVKQAKRTVFSTDIHDSTHNAYAGPLGDGYRIQILGGLINWVGHYVFLKTLHDAGMPTDKLLYLTEWTRIFYKTSTYSEDDIASAITQEMVWKSKIDFAKYRITSPDFIERWRSNILDAMLFVVAHELGHICLGHCDNPGYDGTVMSSNRNMERQADLFACSIVQCASSVTSKGVGGLLLNLSLHALDPDYSGDSTHPNAVERVEDIITSFGKVIPKADADLIRKMLAVTSKAKIPAPKKPKKPKKGK